MNIVQYIIVRADLNMTHGKMAAQVAHASNASFYPYMDDQYVKEWLDGSFTKIILRVKSKIKMENIIDRLNAVGLINVPIVDNCITQLVKETENGTLTCVGIKPYPKDMVVVITKKLRLYE